MKLYEVTANKAKILINAVASRIAHDLNAKLDKSNEVWKNKIGEAEAWTHSVNPEVRVRVLSRVYVGGESLVSAMAKDQIEDDIYDYLHSSFPPGNTLGISWNVKYDASGSIFYIFLDRTA